MQIKLKELLENMTAEDGEQAAAQPAEGDGVVAASVEDGPSVAAACPPTPRKSISSIQAAIDAASLDEEALAQADFFNPPPDAPRTTMELDTTDVEEQVVSHRPRRRPTPPPPPKRDDADEQPAAALAAPATDIADQPTAPSARSSDSMDAAVHGEEEYEPQTFSPSMLSPLSRRPSGVSEAVKPPRRDSGLIDVRSMAAAYREYDGLVKKGKEAREAEGESSPLPILGASEHTSPILLPTQTAPAHASRWLYALVAVLGAIVVIGSTVAVTALILKRRDAGGQSFAALSPTERAALCEAEAEAARIREDEERIAAAAPVPAAVAESEAVTAADVAGTAPVTAPALEISSSSRKSGSDGDDDDDHDRHHRSSRDRSGRDDGAASSSSRTSSSSPTASTASSTTPTPTATPVASKPTKPAVTDDLAAAAGGATGGGSEGEKCDEVECLVSGRGCCGKNPKGAGSASKGDEPPPDPNLPARPERSDITSGIASVQNRLQSCGDRHSVRGAVTVKISIAPSGGVTSASTSQGSSEFQSCIAGALKGAKFPATQQGAKVSYPVVLK